MTYLALALAAVALVLALDAQRRSRPGGGNSDDAAREARRIASGVEERLRAEIDITRRMLADLARGATLDPAAVLEGQLWRDVDGAEAAKLVAAGGVTIVDVRTPGETRGGVIPGAKLIPLDELDARKGEVPKDGRVLIYCAAGGRSAAACEGLSREGWSGLMNLEGGIGAWRGPTARP